VNEETSAKAWSELHLMRQRLASLEERHAAEIVMLKSRLKDLESLLSPVEIPTAVERPSLIAEEVPTPSPPPPRPFAAAKIEPPIQPVSAMKPVDRTPLELRFGRVWLVRIGIALLLTGFVLLGNFAYKNWIRDLPAEVRLAALYICSLALSGAGMHLGRKENLKRFGEVLLAGGMAFFYWCTFASHHVTRLKVVESPVLAGGMLLAVAVGIIGIALRRGSRAVAVMGLLFASYATVLQPLGWLSAASNLVLAIAGMGLMTRREWGAPGIVAMAGIYLSFLWWQIAGAVGMRPQDVSALCFLPPVWAAFALPGVTGIARYFPGLPARLRAWFLSANHGAFFVLFSALWMELRGGENYWAVPAVFGSVLMAMGAIGRRSDPASGSAQLAQGLAAITLAMTLKLEGDALALGFAIQAVLTGIAFARFGGRIEMVTSALAALAGAVWLIFAGDLGHDIPPWNRALVALLIMGSVFPLHQGWQRHGASEPARGATLLALAAGSVAALFGWCLHLADGPRYLSLLGVATAMSCVALLLDRKRHLPEVGHWSRAFHGTGLLFLLKVHPTFSWARELGVLAWWWPAAALLMGLAGHWLWTHRAPERPKGEALASADLSACLTALIAVASVHSLIAPLDLAVSTSMVVFGTTALALAAAARYLLGSPMLIAASVLFLGELLGGQAGSVPIPWPAEFLPLLVAGGIAYLAYGPVRDPISLVAGAAARVFAVISWIAAWSELAPEYWEDVVATSALVLMAIPGRVGRGRMAEPWALLGISVCWLVAKMAVAPWQLIDSPPISHGSMVVAALLAAPFMVKLTRLEFLRIRPVLIFGGCSLLAAWCTQAMVWHLGWKPVAVVWTVLGFTMVSAGLWRRIATVRHVGFALLGIAVIKLFAVDVWDFATFFRVTAFLSLGVALVVLGFFYNRFADVLKKLLEGDRA
jgi:uncharacterized membrane protein